MRSSSFTVARPIRKKKRERERKKSEIINNTYSRVCAVHTVHKVTVFFFLVGRTHNLLLCTLLCKLIINSRDKFLKTREEAEAVLADKGKSKERERGSLL